MALNINGTTGISGVDGSASAASIAGTDANTGLSFASDTVNINTGGTTRATITSGGELELTNNIKWGSANPFVYSYNGGSSGQVRSGIQFDGTSQQMEMYTNTNERMRIDSTGGLRVGTTSNIFNTAVSEQASIKQTDNGHALTLEATNITGGYPILWLYSSDTTSSQNAIIFQRTGGAVGTITTSASSTAYNTSSDYRLKENAVPISDGITRLKTLKPYRFNWKIDKSTTVDGFFAHEVTAVPEAVTGTKDQVSTDEDGTIPKGDPIYQTMDQSKLVPLLTAALQEAIAKIEVLETKVAALEAG